MSHNAPHETIGELAGDVLSNGKAGDWSRSARVKYGLEHGRTWEEVIDDLKEHFAAADSLTEEQRAILKDSPFV